MRLIDADLAVEEMPNEIKDYEYWLKAQPTVSQWIPVSERVPEKPEENPVFENKPLELYLVSVKNADYAFRAFWNGTSFTDGWSKLDVIAWMPMPEPYKEEIQEAVNEK